MGRELDPREIRKSAILFSWRASLRLGLAKTQLGEASSVIIDCQDGKQLSA